MRSFGNAFRSAPATCSAVAMKRQNTTGLAPSAISGLSSFVTASSLGSGALVKLLGLRHQSGERARLARGRTSARHRRHRLHPSLRRKPASKPIGIGGEPVAQRARGRSRRRADAAHQRQRAPEGQPSPTLIGPAPSTTPRQ